MFWIRDLGLHLDLELGLSHFDSLVLAILDFGLKGLSVVYKAIVQTFQKIILEL